MGDSSPFSLSDGDEIPAGFLLYRRIPDDGAHWVPEEKRPAGYNLCPSTTQDHLSMAFGPAYPPEDILADNPGLGLLEIDSASLTSRGLRAVYTPQLGRGHVSVYGLKGSAHAAKKLRNAICNEVLRVWEPVSQQLLPPQSARS